MPSDGRGETDADALRTLALLRPAGENPTKGQARAQKKHPSQQVLSWSFYSLPPKW